MSTNYYMMTTNKDLAEKHFPNEYRVTDSPYFGYEIHIGKRSCGWKPLFQEHKNAYSSVKEMLGFSLVNKNDIRIFDEYERELDINELKEELITWEEKQEKRMIHYDGVPGLIQSPIDHVEMANREPNRYCIYPKYWHDKDGYDFTEGDFS